MYNQIFKYFKLNLVVKDSGENTNSGNLISDLLLKNNEFPENNGKEKR